MICVHVGTPTMYVCVRENVHVINRIKRWSYDSEINLKIRSLIKEVIDIFESDIFCKSNAEKRKEFKEKLSFMSVEIMESELTEESYQVSFTIARYVVKQILKKMSCDVCKNKLISMHGNGHGSEYLDILNRGGWGGGGGGD